MKDGEEETERARQLEVGHGLLQPILQELTCFYSPAM